MRLKTQLVGMIPSGLCRKRLSFGVIPSKGEAAEELWRNHLTSPLQITLVVELRQTTGEAAEEKELLSSSERFG